MAKPKRHRRKIDAGVTKHALSRLMKQFGLNINIGNARTIIRACREYCEENLNTNEVYITAEFVRKYAGYSAKMVHIMGIPRHKRCLAKYKDGVITTVTDTSPKNRQT